MKHLNVDDKNMTIKNDKIMENEIYCRVNRKQILMKLRHVMIITTVVSRNNITNGMDISGDNKQKTRCEVD